MLAKAKGDEARRIVKTSEAAVETAEAELERAKQQLGDADAEDNPQMRRAMAQLEKANLDLTRTTLTAPSRGYVAGLKIDEGAFATAGQPTMTFISVDDIWVEAYLTENQLGLMKRGDKVELAFDIFPGQIFEGKVKSMAVGVSTGKKDDLGDLPSAKANRGWLRDAQRFPAIIEMTNIGNDDSRESGLRLNGQVDVIVYTGDRGFWNLLGKFWIRLMSYLSYAY